MLSHHRQQLAVILLLSCIYCLVAPIETRSRDKEGRRRERLSSAATASSASSSSASSSYNSASNSPFGTAVDTVGFCTRRRDMKLMCYCTPDESHQPVQKAECWVFSDGLLLNDTTWTRFYQQKRLRDLKFVIQNHGRLDYIPTMIIEPLKNLTTLTIEYSQVEVVRSHAFANLAHLERIILNNNQIMALDQDAFANHIRLRDLNLEQNQIFEIDRYAFRNLPLCERLLLNNNNISNLHEGIFSEMPRLVYLNLAHNQISVLTSEIFKGLGNLNVLKLTHNSLNFIGDTVFAELWSLVELELDDNHIERISERALDGLNNLKTLNLRNNLLKKIDNGLLRGTPALLSINVQSNELETLTFYTFQPIMDNLVNSTSELLLSDNNFICDCRLQWIFELKNRTRHMPLRDALEEFVCTLQEPKLENFIEPVPNHILDLLSLSGYSSNSNSNIDMHNSLGNGRRRPSKLRQPQRGQRQVRQMLPPTELQSPPALVAAVAALTQPTKHMKQRRSLVKTFTGTTNPDGNLNLEPSNVAYSSSTSGSISSHGKHDYYDDTHGMLAQQVELDGSIDLLKQNALYTPQLNDVLSSNKLDALGTGDGVSKQSLGFKVRLFILRPEQLPCHDELSDPTELPLSRDLMDVRSNVQSNYAHDGATWLQPPTQAVMLMATLFVILGIRNDERPRVG